LQVKSELDKEYFERFIKPTWDCFVANHKNYKQSLEEYSELLSQEGVQLPDVVNRIKHDLIYTMDLRGELKSLVQSMPPSKFKAEKASLSKFIGSIIAYFYSPMFLLSVAERNRKEADALLAELLHGASELDVPKDEPLMIANYARHALISFGRDARNNEYTMQTLLLTIMQVLQNQYEEVSVAYHQLRKELLT
jgi:hypothetical protein